MTRRPLTTTISRLDEAFKKTSTRQAAAHAFGRKYSTPDMEARLYEEGVIKGCRQWPQGWRVPAKYRDGYAKAAPGAAPSGDDPTVPMVQLRCPACGAMIDMPAASATIPCIKCYRVLRIDIVTKRTVTIQLSD